MFSPDDIEAAVLRAVPELPDGHTNGVAGLVDEDGIKVAAIVATIDGHLRVKGVFEHDWDTKDNTVAAQILASW